MQQATSGNEVIRKEKTSEVAAAPPAAFLALATGAWPRGEAEPIAGGAALSRPDWPVCARVHARARLLLATDNLLAAIHQQLLV